MTDTEHVGRQGSFGDSGSTRLKRDGDVVGENGYPFGVFG